MPGRRKITGKALGAEARIIRRRAFFEQRYSEADSPTGRLRVRTEQLVTAVANAPAALIPAVADEVCARLAALTADIERQGHVA